MAHVTVTVTKINFQTVSSLKRAVETSKIENMRPTTEGNLATAAIFELNEGNGVKSTYYVSETYADLLTAMNAADAEAGAQLTTGKDASNGYAGLTLLKINFKNVANTFTSFFTNTNTAARTYTFQDRNGTIADDTDLALKAPLASPTFTGVVTITTEATGNSSTRAASTEFVQNTVAAKIIKGTGTLVAGVLSVSAATAGVASYAIVQKVSLGGTVAAGGYKVTMSAGVGFTVTALQADGTTTETANTDVISYILAI